MYLLNILEISECRALELIIPAEVPVSPSARTVHKSQPQHLSFDLGATDKCWLYYSIHGVCALLLTVL